MVRTESYISALRGMDSVCGLFHDYAVVPAFHRLSVISPS